MQVSHFYKLSFRTWLILVMLAIATALSLFNLFTYKYQASSYIGFDNFLSMLPTILIYYIARELRSSHSHLAFLLEAFCTIIFISVLINFFSMAIQYTPFQLHDAQVLQWDLDLGFNQIAIINWFHQFPVFINLLKISYSIMITQVFAAPLVLALLQQQRRFDVFINVCLITSIIGYVFYYFFPTAGPADTLSSVYFTQAMAEIPIRFYDVQHYIPNNHIAGGIIALPSFHVIWAICVAYSFKNYKMIFYPLLAWNTLAIIATIALGWHYLIDVIVGILLATFAIMVAEKKAKTQDYALQTLFKSYKQEIKPIS